VPESRWARARRVVARGGGHCQRRLAAWAEGVWRRRAAAKVQPANARAAVVLDHHPWMLSPTRPFRMGWDLGLVVPLLLYLTLVMPYRVCFDNEPVLKSPTYWFEASIEMVKTEVRRQLWLLLLRLLFR